MPKTIKRKELPKTVGFHFDEEAHAYTLDGRPLHGVTSVLGVIAKPMLIQWAANMACDYVLENAVFGEDDAISVQMSQGELKTIIKEAKTAHRKKKEDAGSKGTDVHAEVERLIKTAIEYNDGRIMNGGQTESDEANKQVNLFVDWATHNNVRFLESEKRVYSESGWYGGTLDMIFEMGGKKWIGDVKTGRAIYPEYYLQMAAYQMALEEMKEHDDISGAIVINLKKTGGIEIGRNYDYQGNKLAFLAALCLHKHLK